MLDIDDTHPFNASLSTLIDQAEAQAQRARELGWDDVARVFERARDELIGLIDDRAAVP